MGRRTRSPNYPRISLRDAIERVEKLYKKERTHTTTREAIAEGLGYTSLNGSSMGTISTLRQYGLLVEETDGIRVSQAAVALVMLPESDPERMQALREAAFAPRLFSEFHEEYGGTLPSDVSLRYALIKKGFSEKAANDAIRAYRDTLELVSEEAAEYHDADDDQQTTEPPMEQGTVNRQASAPQSYGGGVGVSLDSRMMQFQLPGNSAARIELLGDVTQEGIEMLKAILDAQKPVFPKENRLEPPTVEQPALEPPEPE